MKRTLKFAGGPADPSWLLGSGGMGRCALCLLYCQWQGCDVALSAYAAQLKRPAEKRPHVVPCRCTKA